MKNVISEKAIAIIARHLCQSITIRTYDDAGNSFDNHREANSQEQDILFKIAQGALLGINYCARNNKDMVQAILDSSEFTLMHFIPGVNGYDSLYAKLKAVTDIWEDSTGDKTLSHWQLTGIWNLFDKEMRTIDDWLDYADEDSLVTMDREGAETQIEEMKVTFQDDLGDELPEDLEDPDIMMLLWNAYVRTK